MKFIDKTLNQNKGHLLINTFLNGQWNSARYVQIGYKDNRFQSSPPPDLKELLLEEQSNLCCYCMRLLTETTTTLEHIIPKSSTTTAEFERYSHYEIIGTNVCLQSVFDNASTQLNTPPFPLEIAYENLVASCRGDFPENGTYHTCNHKRQTIFVEPLFYVPTIEAEIAYQRGGLVSATSEDVYDTSINVLNLNYRTLQNIRQIWCHISAESIDNIEQASTEIDRNEILTIHLIGVPSVKRHELIATFKTEEFWNILMKYKWFHGYYLNSKTTTVKY